MLIEIKTRDGNKHYIDAWDIRFVGIQKKYINSSNFGPTIDITIIQTHSKWAYESDEGILSVVKRINDARKNVSLLNKSIKVSRAELLDIGD